MLIILLPILFVISIFIFFEDGFPIFFKQKRVGQYQQMFWIIKFRSMKKATPNVATHLLDNPDKYLLKCGKLIRKLSIDELPNLINIVKGEMVFIGPRPALFNQDDLIGLRKKHGIDVLKPGLTGWAQVNGRDEIELHKKVKLDEYYLINKSFKLDLKILLKTFFKVISFKNISH